MLNNYLKLVSILVCILFWSACGSGGGDRPDEIAIPRSGHSLPSEAKESWDGFPDVDAAGLRIVFSSGRMGSPRIFKVVVGDTLSAPEPLSQNLVAEVREKAGFISPDGSYVIVIGSHDYQEFINLVDFETGERQPLPTVADDRLSGIRFSRDSRFMTYLAHGSESSSIHLVRRIADQSPSTASVSVSCAVVCEVPVGIHGDEASGYRLVSVIKRDSQLEVLQRSFQTVGDLGTAEVISSTISGQDVLATRSNEIYVRQSLQGGTFLDPWKGKSFRSAAEIRVHDVATGEEGSVLPALGVDVDMLSVTDTGLALATVQIGFGNCGDPAGASGAARSGVLVQRDPVTVQHLVPRFHSGIGGWDVTGSPCDSIFPDGFAGTLNLESGGWKVNALGTEQTYIAVFESMFEDGLSLGDSDVFVLRTAQGTSTIANISTPVP